MRIKFIFLYLFLTICQWLPSQSMFSDDYIHALASLVFHTQEWEKQCAVEETISEENIHFSNEDITQLWNKVNHALTHASMQRIAIFKKAYQAYEQAHQHIQTQDVQEAQRALHSCAEALSHLWHEAIACDETFSADLFIHQNLRAKSHPNFEHNPHLTSKIQQAIQPYLLPMRHKMRPVLDSLFTKNRITQDQAAFYKAGFRTIAKGPRSFICVAKHAKMPGYLVKVYLDTELKKKFHKESWEWLVRRCQGASKVRDIIQTRHIRHFVVASKWIYCLPPEPSPPNDKKYTRHLALLLVTDMHLVSEKHNQDAWYHYITQEHLEELFEIISRAKGSSYRPDNIAYTKKGTFAFIDTEYPSRGPDFESIRHYLHPKMREYWDALVRQGGKSS